MALVSLKDITLGFGGQPLLDKISLQIEPVERICLVGRNGVGKSTLMRIIHGQQEPDAGEVIRQKGLRVAFLSQEVPEAIEGRVIDIVRASGDLTKDPAWQAIDAAERILSKMALDPAAQFETLSAGLKRRVLLARGLVNNPDLVLLDEPTNHLDIEAIGWLENFLLRETRSLMFVTHDRVFLQKLATRVVDLDRGNLSSWACDYETYLKRKADALAAEETQQANFDKKLAAEEAWIRQGIKARRTRNEGRVRALKQLREQRRQRRQQPGAVQMRIQQARSSGRLVMEAENLCFDYGGKPLIQNFSTTVMRGDKVGIIGPNGCGKTTLLNLLLGHLAPTSGSVRLGTGLEIAYYDQLRATLDGEKSVAANLAEGNDWVEIDGRRRHVIGYLQDFLFTPDRARTPVRVLSGGERNRLLLARLFAKPSNVLVLDEPTNDLDMETLDLLEERLHEYTGTVLLVSHDRAFLNHVVSHTLAFEDAGGVGEYIGGYDDWLWQRPTPAADPLKPGAVPRPEKRRSPAKLGYQQQRELDALPAAIEALEAEQGKLYAVMADPAFYQRGHTVAETTQRLAAVEAELEASFARWEQLETLRTELSRPSAA
jgi:ATP-binding cassette subfamily F protein uup